MKSTKLAHILASKTTQIFTNDSSMESPDWLEGLLNKASVQVPKEAKTLSLLKARPDKL